MRVRADKSDGSLVSEAEETSVEPERHIIRQPGRAPAFAIVTAQAKEKHERE